MSSIPIISAMPQFGSSSVAPDDLAASSPVYQSLLAQTGGNTQNLDAMAAMNPQLGNMVSLMSPGGGLNMQQASQFGPLFAMLMSLQGGGMPQGGQK
jgi:hypothetical protein